MRFRHFTDVEIAEALEDAVRTTAADATGREKMEAIVRLQVPDATPDQVDVAIETMMEATHGLLLDAARRLRERSAES